MTAPTETTSGATLKTTLDGLGLPPSWFADHCQVTMRTVVRWFDSSMVSAEVANELERISERATEEMRRMLAEVEGAADPIILRTYRTDKEVAVKHGKWPASWHRMVAFRAKEQLETRGHTVVVEYL